MSAAGKLPLSCFPYNWTDAPTLLSCSYGRQYRVAGYEDDFTRKALGRGSERCFGLVSAAGIRAGALGDVWSAVEAAGLRVARAKMVQLSQVQK